jgi:hypothetical protein
MVLSSNGLYDTYINNITKTRPAIVHFSGKLETKALYNEFVQTLEYDREKVNAGEVELEKGMASYKEICLDNDKEWDYGQ